MVNTFNDSPIVKLFLYEGRYFIYDAFLNRIIEVSKEQYLEVLELVKIGLSKYTSLDRNTNSYNDIKMLITKGMFRTCFVDKIQHPETEHVANYLRRCIKELTLQVAKTCNFKCRYCSQHNSFVFNKEGQNLNMPWEVAKKSLEFLRNHSLDARTIELSFYGGEPLLNFILIAKSVKYAEKLFQTKKINYRMTTNGSLLQGHILDFIVEHNFKLSISLDGPELVQNQHRKFAEDGKGTFEIVYNNVMVLKHKYEKYFLEQVSFLPAILLDENRDYIFRFFDELGVINENISPLEIDLAGTDYIYSTPDNVEKNVFTLSPLDKHYKMSGEMEKHLEEIYGAKTVISKKWHPNGMCIPGVKLLFVDTNGIFYPCEKIQEHDIFSIGSIEQGLNIDKIVNFMNIGKLTEAECKTCWALRFCEMCISSCVDIEKNQITKEHKLKSCDEQKALTLNFFKKYLNKRICKHT